MKAFLFLLFIFNCSEHEAQNIDYQILKNISKRRSPSDNGFNHFISNTAPYVTVGTPILMYGIGLIEKDEALQKKSLEIGVSVAATVVEAYALKYIVKRPRPYVTYPDLNALDTEGSPSFPSGHTSGAFALATSLSLNYPKWYVVVPSVAFAGFTGYSRMYLGVHYPSDVLAGAVLGSGTAWLTWKVNKAWQKRLSKKK
ncbi:MAG: phosphatase PAP2 family protein [Saprospiraceae bacterium]|nr:phosphatase PAP2 family protein [Saprospiraceae bacterium]